MTMIRGDQLAHICSNLDPEIKPYFRGVYALNELLTDALSMIDLNKENYFVFNTDTKDKPGSHWVGAVIDINKKSVFIDSYGKSPNYYDMEEFFDQACDGDFISIDKQLQSNFTNVCGLYVIYFLHFIAKGTSLTEILKTIPKMSKVLVDRYMLEWFVKNYGKTIVLNTPFIDCKKFTKTNPKQSCKKYEKMLLDRESI